LKLTAEYLCYFEMENFTGAYWNIIFYYAEILDFCDFISPSAEEQSSRSAAVQAVSDVVNHIWPQCKAS
jgi:DNA polymerase sigma